MSEEVTPIIQYITYPQRLPMTLLEAVFWLGVSLIIMVGLVLILTDRWKGEAMK